MRALHLHCGGHDTPRRTLDGALLHICALASGQLLEGTQPAGSTGCRWSRCKAYGCPARVAVPIYRERGCSPTRRSICSRREGGHGTPPMQPRPCCSHSTLACAGHGEHGMRASSSRAHLTAPSPRSTATISASTMADVAPPGGGGHSMHARASLLLVIHSCSGVQVWAPECSGQGTTRCRATERQHIGGCCPIASPTANSQADASFGTA